MSFPSGVNGMGSRAARNHVMSLSSCMLAVFSSFTPLNLPPLLCTLYLQVSLGREFEVIPLSIRCSTSSPIITLNAQKYYLIGDGTLSDDISDNLVNAPQFGVKLTPSTYFRGRKTKYDNNV